MGYRYYAGVGSRETPDHICRTMTNFARFAATKGYVLRSGGAEGADQAFEAGTDKAEVFLPQGSPLWTNAFTDLLHPAPERLSTYARLLHNRNALIMLGQGGDKPVEFVVCWTKDGKSTGGTGQALRIAEYLNIPVYNFFFTEHMEQLREFFS